MPADLSQIDIFQELPPDSLARLTMLSRERTFSVGSQLLRQDTTSDRVYLIVKGRVRIERAHPELSEPVTLAESGPSAIAGPGAIVGNIHLLASRASRPSPITVRVVEEVRAVELSTLALALTMLQYPEGSTALLRTLHGRLHNTNEPEPQLSHSTDFLD